MLATSRNSHLKHVVQFTVYVYIVHTYIQTYIHVLNSTYIKTVPTSCTAGMYVLDDGMILPGQEGMRLTGDLRMVKRGFCNSEGWIRGVPLCILVCVICLCTYIYIYICIHTYCSHSVHFAIYVCCSVQAVVYTTHLEHLEEMCWPK